MESNKKYGKDFMLVVVGQIVSLFGNAILRFAMPLYLLRETGSSALYGMVTACSFLPMIVLSLLGGVLADRVNKRNIMVCLDFATAFIIVVFYMVLNVVPIVPLFIVTLMLLYGISGTYYPAVQASIPVLVSKEKILSASAIVNQIGALANFIGPIIGGMLYGIWGIGIILMVSVPCFIFSALMEMFIVIPFSKQHQKDKILQIVKKDLNDSVQFLRFEKPVYLQVCFVIAGLNLFLSSLISIGVPVIIVDRLAMSDQMLGITQGLFAIGGVIGGLLTVLLEKRLHPAKAFVFLFLSALSICIMGVGMIPQELPFLKYVVLTGMGFAGTVSITVFNIQMMAIVQAETPGNLVGKVVACLMTIIMCAQPAGQLIYGMLFEWIPNVAVIVLGGSMISLCIAMYSKKVLVKL